MMYGEIGGVLFVQVYPDVLSPTLIDHHGREQYKQPTNTVISRELYRRDDRIVISGKQTIKPQPNKYLTLMSGIDCNGLIFAMPPVI